MVCTQFINQKPASNFHHAIRIAEVIDRPLNEFVTIDFGSTSCSPESVTNVFQQLRTKFSRWITRYTRKSSTATFVWVIERPPGSPHFNAHWLLHVPKACHQEFVKKLPLWLTSVAGNILDERAAIHIRPAPTPRAAGRYMLKGMHPSWAAHYDIRHEPQGVVIGRRSGFTKNLGPKRKRHLRAIDLYPKARHWVSFKAS